MLKYPFNVPTPSLPALALKIVQGKYDAFPDTLDVRIQNVIKAMLTLDPTERPAVKDLLGYTFVEEIVEKFEINKDKIEFVKNKTAPFLSKENKSGSIGTSSGG